MHLFATLSYITNTDDEYPKIHDDVQHKLCDIDDDRQQKKKENQKKENRLQVHGYWCLLIGTAQDNLEGYSF